MFMSKIVTIFFIINIRWNINVETDILINFDGFSWFLVSGFGPFGEHRVNASWETVKLLAKKGLGNDIDLVTYEIPVEYDTVRKVLPTYWEKHAPDVS